MMVCDPERSVSARSWPVLCLHWTLCFLLVTVPLIPYRYLVLPFHVPPHLLFAVRFTPLIFSFSAAALWIAWRRHTLVSVLERLPLSGPVVGLFLAGVMSSLGAADPGSSLSREVYYFLTGGMLCLIVADLYVETGRPRLPLLVLVSTAYLVAAYGIIEFAWRQNPVFQAVFSPENAIYLQLSPDPWFGRRILSSIGHPVFLGAYLVPFLPISLSLLFQARARSAQAAFLGGTGVLLGALLLTFSRGAWVAGFIAVLAYLKLRGTRYLLAVCVMFCVCLFLFLSFGGVSEIFWERIGAIYEQYILDFPSSSRGQAYGYVAEMIGRHPLFGVGTGMYRFNAYDLGRSIHWPATLDTPDNMYLIRLAEQGSLGLFALIFLLVHLFRFLFRAGQYSGEQAWAFMAGYIGLCVEMLTCSVLHFPTTRIVFWMLTGLAVAAHSRSHIQSLR